MSSIVASILLKTATKVGAPLVIDALSNRFGAGSGKIAETVINAVAEKTGFDPEKLSECDESNLEAAISQVENNMPEIILASVMQQEETNRLLLAEMEKGQTWTWAWRPAFMWAILAFWVWSLVLAPALSLILGHEISHPLADQMLTISLAYLALYMGGHTAKQFAIGRKHE